MVLLTRWSMGMLGLTLFATAQAAGTLPSQARQPDEPFEEAAARELGDAIARGGTAYNSAVPLRSLDYSGAVSWSNLSWSEIQGWFEQGRDERYLTVPGASGFPRRPSWLYPDDGCFARGGVLSQWLGRHGLDRPSKVFIFGNLRVRTPNAPGGAVYWWYHVVTGVTVSSRLMVFDPAIEPSRPLELTEWVRTMTSDVGSVRLSVCNPYAYVPDSSCLSSSSSEDSVARSQQNEYLRREWNRMLELGRDPHRELGDSPPWSH